MKLMSDTVHQKACLLRWIQEIQILDVGDNEIAVVVVLNGEFNEYGEVFDMDGGVELAHNGDYKPIPLEEVRN